MRRFFSIFLMFAVIATAVNFVNLPKAEAVSSTIGTSTATSATSGSAQRKTFFDTVSSKHWAFYNDGTTIKFSYSSDGTSWLAASDPVVALPDTTDFAVSYKTISGTSYVFLVAVANSHDIIIRRGTLAATSISFDSAITVFDGTSNQDKYSKPGVALDGNNFLWLAAVKDFGTTAADHFQAVVRRSTNIGSGDLSALESASSVGRTVISLNSLVIMPQTGSNMYLIINGEDQNITGYAYNGSTWSEANTGGDYSWFAYPGGIDNDVTGGRILTVAMYGSDLFVGGDFNTIGGVTARHIARWDGSAWNSISQYGVWGSAIYSIAVRGSNLYFAGDFSGVWKWDGTNITQVGSNFAASGMAIRTLAVSSDGSIYAGGYYLSPSYATTNLMKWNGSAWISVGVPNNPVNSIAIDGSDNVYIAGEFTNIDSVDYSHVAKWNGSSWSALGTGADDNIYSIVVYGSDVVIGGYFTTAGGVSAPNIAKWGGASWSAFDVGLNSTVKGLTVSGTDLYATGLFTQTSPAGTTLTGIAKWGGASWSALGNGIDTTGIGNYANIPANLVVSGNDLYVAANFVSASGVPAKNLAHWDGTAWSGMGNGADSWVEAVKVSGSNVYVGGMFTTIGGINARHIAVWNGSAWSALGVGIADEVKQIEVSGSDVYVGFSGTTNYNRIAKWSSGSWSGLGTGLSGTPSVIKADGSGGVYVGGTFATAGGVAVNNIAHWAGSWSAVGDGTDGQVYDVAISGSDLYAAGSFITAGGVTVNKIAKWNGSSWSALGTGLNDTATQVKILGSNIYASGAFTTAGGVSAARVAKWDGENWSALGSGFSGAPTLLGIWNNQVVAIVQTTLNSSTQNYFLEWNGSGWDILTGVTTDNTISAADFSTASIYVGGLNMTSINGTTNLLTRNLAKYGLAVASGVNSSAKVSASIDGSNNIHLIYTDSSSHLKYKEYNNSLASWGSAVTLSSSSTTMPTISYDTPSNKLVALWQQSNNIYYKIGASPYASGNWDVSATLLTSSGTNSGLVSDPVSGGMAIKVAWSDNSVSPSNVLSEIIAIDSTPPVISSVSFSPSSGWRKIGDTVTMTIVSDGADYTAGAISINGVAATGFTHTSGNNYTVVYTVASGNSDIADSATIPVSVVLTDTIGNSNVAYTTSPLAANSPAIDGHVPTISSVTSDATSTGWKKIDDTINFTLTPGSIEASGVVAGSYNGHSLTWSTADSGVHFTAAYTIGSGDEDQTSALQIDGVTIADAAGNVSDAAAGTDVAKKIDAHRPTAEAGPNKSTYPGLSVTQVGTASGASTYTWSKVGGPGTLSFGAADATTTVSASLAGSYTVRLTASDAAGNSTTADMSLTVQKSGDVNNDGLIDELDFASLLTNWGASISNPMADYNADSTVDELDFATLLTNWSS